MTCTNMCKLDIPPQLDSSMDFPSGLPNGLPPWAGRLSKHLCAYAHVICMHNIMTHDSHDFRGMLAPDFLLSFMSCMACNMFRASSFATFAAAQTHRFWSGVRNWSGVRYTFCSYMC